MNRIIHKKIREFCFYIITFSVIITVLSNAYLFYESYQNNKQSQEIKFIQKNKEYTKKDYNEIMSYASLIDTTSSIIKLDACENLCQILGEVLIDYPSAHIISLDIKSNKKASIILQIDQNDLSSIIYSIAHDERNTTSTIKINSIEKNNEKYIVYIER